MPAAGGVGVAQQGPAGAEPGNLGAGDVEVQGGSGSGPFGNKIFDDLRLRVDRHAAAGQVAEVDMVALARELRVDAAVRQALAVQPGGQPGGAE